MFDRVADQENLFDFHTPPCYDRRKGAPMDSVTLEITLPKQMLLSLGLSRDDAVRALKKSLVLQLVRDQRISAGKAAELLGISKFEFIVLMSANHVAYFDYSSEELDEELNNVNEWLAANRAS
jgi:predicted HTH domain antitoxin